MEFTKEQKQRISDAKEALDAICENYKVQLVPQMMIVQGQIVNHSVGIVPDKEENRIVVPTMHKGKVDEIVKDVQNGS